MGQPERDAFIIGPSDRVLVTGATGFIGSSVVETLLNRGSRNLRCFARLSSDVARVEAAASHQRDGVRIEMVTSNLLSREDCARATRDVAVIFHLAEGKAEKSFPSEAEVAMRPAVQGTDHTDIHVRGKVVSVRSAQIDAGQYSPPANGSR